MRYEDFPFHLKSAVWEITLACCFNCAYCGSRGGKARDNELCAAECDSVAQQLAAMGCERVSLIGGEVFMRKDWEEIVTSLTSRGIKTCIITNGYRMTPEIISSLKASAVESVAVSLDGTEAVHDPYRQNGSFKRALETIKALTGSGIPVSVITSLRKDNAPCLSDFYDILRGLPIFAWQLQACSPMGNAEKNRLEVGFDAEEVLRFVRDTAFSAPFYVGVADNIGYYTPEEGAVRGIEGLRFEGCSAGLTTLGIDSVGNVRGCESMYDERFIEGNLRKRTLEDIWMDENSFGYNRKFTPELLSGGCADCRYGNVCAGGCRSYNYFSTGNLYENPLCPTGKNR